MLKERGGDGRGYKLTRSETIYKTILLLIGYSQLIFRYILLVVRDLKVVFIHTHCFKLISVNDRIHLMLVN